MPTVWSPVGILILLVRASITVICWK